MKKKKISFKNLIYDNRFVLALSIIAAVIIWIVVAIQASPEDDRIIKDVPVKIEISNKILLILSSLVIRLKSSKIYCNSIAYST